MSKSRLAKRILDLPPYLFAELDRAKAELEAQGKEVISLGIGDPDMPTPEPIIEALKRGPELVGDVFLEPRGSRRGDDRYNLDLQVAKNFRLGGDKNVQAVVSIENVFSDEQPTIYQVNEFQSTPWGTATRFTQPRRYQLGFRFEF